MLTNSNIISKIKVKQMEWFLIFEKKKDLLGKKPFGPNFVVL